jgi:hypothetical protein
VETVSWTVVFTSDVEALEGDKITKWSQLKTGGVYILDADLTATGSRTISSDTVVDLNGHAIRYGNKNNGAPFKGNLFHVTGGPFKIIALPKRAQSRAQALSKAVIPVPWCWSTAARSSWKAAR